MAAAVFAMVAMVGAVIGQALLLELLGWLSER